MTETLLKSGEVIQTVGGLFMVATYIPQILLLFKSKSAKNQSVSFWVMLVISLSTFTYNGLLLFMFRGVTSVLVTQGINLFLALVVLTQILFYRRKRS